MLNDLAALAPPLLMCTAFLVAVVAFLRREMGDKERPSDDNTSDPSAEQRNPDGTS